MNAHTLRVALTAAAGLVLLSITGSAFALDAYWHGVRSDVWNDGIDPATEQSNWYADPPPTCCNPRKVPEGTAIFANGALRTSLRVTKNTEIGRMRFLADAPRYAFRIVRGRVFELNGLGLINQSAATPNIRVIGNGKPHVQGGTQLVLTGQAHFVAGGGVPSVRVVTTDRALLGFYDRSGGGDAIVTNQGRSSVLFSNMASAERMTITNRSGADVAFITKSTGDQAHLINERSGAIHFAGDGPAGDSIMPVGAVDNEGEVIIAGDQLLKVRRGFSQTAQGTVQVGIFSATRFGAIETGGNLVLGGTLVVKAFRTTGPGSYKIIQAGGRRSGRFDTLTFSGRDDLKARLAYSGKEVTVIIEEK